MVEDSLQIIKRTYQEEFDQINQTRDLRKLADLVVRIINDQNVPMTERVRFLSEALEQNYDVFSRSLVLFRPIASEEVMFQLDKVDFSEDRLFETVFPKNGVARRYLLDKANLTGRVFDNIDLKGTSFCEANLEQASFINSYLEWTKMRNSRLAGANFTKAQLWRTDLAEADCSGSNFSGAQLEEANFKNAILVNANFSNPQSCFGVNLEGADIRGADFSGVDLDGIVNLHLAVNLDFAKFDNAISRHHLIEVKRKRPIPQQLT